MSVQNPSKAMKSCLLLLGFYFVMVGKYFEIFIKSSLKLCCLYYLYVAK